MICGALQTLNEEAMEDVMLGEPSTVPGETSVPLPTISEHLPVSIMKDMTDHGSKSVTCMNVEFPEISNSKMASSDSEVNEFTLSNAKTTDTLRVRFENQSAPVDNHDDFHLEPTAIVITGKFKKSHSAHTIVNIPENDLKKSTK